MRKQIWRRVVMVKCSEVSKVTSFKRYYAPRKVVMHDGLPEEVKMGLQANSSPVPFDHYHRRWDIPPQAPLSPEETIRAQNEVLKVLSVQTEFLYGTTPNWREPPASARVRAKELTYRKLVKNAREYMALELQKEQERQAKLQDLLDRRNAYKWRMKRRRERHRRAYVDKQMEAHLLGKKKLGEQLDLFWEQKDKIMKMARIEAIKSLQEEVTEKIDIRDAPGFYPTQNVKYAIFPPSRIIFDGKN